MGNDKGKSVEGTVEVIDKSVPAGVGEILAAGGTIMRLENSVQMSIAVQRPRDEKAILADALRTLDIYPSMAEEAIYARPVGKDDSGKQKVAEGLSIRAAEDLANRWGNNAFGVVIVSDDGTDVIIEPTYVDYQTNVRRAIQKKVSRFYKAKGGSIVQHPPDRFVDVVLPKNVSVALREVILRSLPAGLKKEYEAKARGILKKDTVERMRTAIEKRFDEEGVDIERVIAHAGGKPIVEFTREECIKYLGFANAIRDGASEDEVLGPKVEPEKKEGGETATGGLPLNAK